MHLSWGWEFTPSTSLAPRTPFWSPHQAPWPSLHHFSNRIPLSYVIPAVTDPATIYSNSYLSVIEIFEKPEQAISEIKLSGITTSFKAVGMEPVVRLVVHMAWMRLGWVWRLWGVVILSRYSSHCSLYFSRIHNCHVKGIEARQAYCIADYGPHGFSSQIHGQGAG